MTNPCVSSDHFDVVDGAIGPFPHLQWRHVATALQGNVQENYLVTGGGDQSEDLFELQVQWTNNAPIAMHCYGLLTRGGSIVTIQPRTRIYIETYFGAAVGTPPADPAANTLVGRMGGGSLLALFTNPARSPFTNHQVRQAERTMVLGATELLDPGETYKLRVRLRFAGTDWETLPIGPSSAAESELSIVTGATRLDLYSYPAL